MRGCGLLVAWPLGLFCAVADFWWSVLLTWRERLIVQLNTNVSEATVDQRSALHPLLDLIGRYVDFAIFGPRHDRMLKKLRMQGMVFGSRGDLTAVQIDGPPTHHLWERCWDLYTTCMIPFRAASLGSLAAYKKHIADYHDRYGVAC